MEETLVTKHHHTKELIVVEGIKALYNVLIDGLEYLAGRAKRHDRVGNIARAQLTELAKRLDAWQGR